MKKTLIAFVKSPIVGDVKTRLIPMLSAEEAAGLYKCFVGDILHSALQLTSTKLLVAYQPNAKLPNLSWTGIKSPLEVFKQEGKSLGERLVHAFGVAFGKGAQRVVIMGSDAPTLPRIYIEQAFQALEEADVVLGPALSGGYYLVGVSRPCLKLFENMSWSSDQVFELTVKRAQQQGYTLRVLPSHYEIDTPADVIKLQQELSSKSSLAPQTEKFLSSLAKNKSLLTAP